MSAIKDVVTALATVPLEEWELTKDENYESVGETVLTLRGKFVRMERTRWMSSDWRYRLVVSGRSVDIDDAGFAAYFESAYSYDPSEKDALYEMRRALLSELGVGGVRPMTPRVRRAALVVTCLMIAGASYLDELWAWLVFVAAVFLIESWEIWSGAYGPPEGF